MTWTTPITRYGTIKTERGPVPGTDPTWAGEVGWGDLVQMLSTHRVTAHKADAGAWSPVSLTTPHRAARHVEGVGCLVMDVDDGTPIARAEEVWAPYRYLLHTSHSHAEDQPRYRVVVPLARVVAPREYRDVWRWAHQRFGCIDRSAKDASRAYYMPARSADGPEPVVRVHDGPALASWTVERPRRRKRSPVVEKAARLLRSEPDYRRAWAGQVGAEVVERPVGEVARGATCPGCGDRSVWWLIDPERAYRARCHHQESCRWTGHLEELA